MSSCASPKKIKKIKIKQHSKSCNCEVCKWKRRVKFENEMEKKDKYNLLSSHPRLKSMISDSFLKYRPNAVYTSESKEINRERSAKIVKKELGIDMSVEQIKGLTGIERGVSQQFGNNFQHIYSCAYGWENLQIGNKTKCDLKNDKKKIVMELKSSNSTTTFKHQAVEKKNGYQWAIENGYQYVYAIIDVDGTDSNYDGEDTTNGGIRTLTKRKLAECIFGTSKAFDFILSMYKLSSKYL